MSDCSAEKSRLSAWQVAIFGPQTTSRQCPAFFDLVEAPDEEGMVARPRGRGLGADQSVTAEQWACLRSQ
jgi:hypothetical protein